MATIKSIEEKAKRYDEAIKKVNDYCEGKTKLYSDVDKTLDYLFPELKESEDWIPKEIIKYLKEKGDFRSCWIAWLEKQGEKKPDKVEPKFHEDDWIVDNGHSYLIGYIDYEQRRYLFEIGGYTHEQLNWEYIENADNKYHLWTIQDAKDGDVLATENFIFIFKNIDSGNGVHYYCHYEISKHEDDNQFDVALPQSLMGRVGNSISHYSPATKEQRDELMKAMADAGYTFDFEKKELKKIEQKSNNNQFTPEQADVLDKHIDKLVEKKSATDFSDLRTWKYIVDAVWTEKEGIGQYLDNPFTEEVAKKLQKRFGNIEQDEEYKIGKWFTGLIPCWINAPSTLQPEHRNHGKNVVAVHLKGGGYRCCCVDDKKPITFSVAENTPFVEGWHNRESSAWSEKDEHILNNIYDFVAENLLDRNRGVCADECLKWLKSLKDKVKPQNTWKPSEEQMEALESATENCAYSEYQDCLRELIEQLKKLMEE